MCTSSNVHYIEIGLPALVMAQRRLEPETQARDLGRARAICAMLGMQITRYTIDNRDTIADRDMEADARAAADSDPRLWSYTAVSGKERMLVLILQCRELYSYTIPSFSVITVEMRRIKYQVGLHDGSTKLWMDSFMPIRRVLGIHSLYLQTAG